MSATERSSGVLVLTAGGAAVRPRPTFRSLVLDRTIPVPSGLRGLEKWIPVEDSVEYSEGITWSVTKKYADAPVCEVTGAELVQAGSGRPVLLTPTLTLKGGVESEVSSDVGLC